jgi:hypothetical protein
MSALAISNKVAFYNLGIGNVKDCHRWCKRQPSFATAAAIC